MSDEASRPSEKVQRLRLRFARGPEAAEVGHLDLSRTWERAFREAGLALSYSSGNRKQVRLTLAAGLAQGVTSEGELLDAVLSERADVATLAQRLAPHLPPGLSVLEVREVGLGLPSLPSLVRWADYVVDVAADASQARAAAERLLSAGTLPWEDTRGEKVRRYDLRPLVRELRVEACDGTARLSMRLRCDQEGVGRPDQVLKALGLPEASRIHRTALVVAEASPAHDAWRRKGRYAS